MKNNIPINRAHFVVLSLMRKKRDKDFTKSNQNKPTTMIPTCLRNKRWRSKSERVSIDLYSA